MPFRKSLRRIAERLETCEEWLELVRELEEPIRIREPSVKCSMRWADKEDLFAVNALQGFVDEPESMENALDKGDRCLLLEQDQRVFAFAWVTFRDYDLALWYTLKVQPGWSYLVYIVVHPHYGHQGVGAYLLGSLMKALREQGCSRLLSGMYSNWEASFRLHTKMGFRVQRRLNQCKILNLFPVPPKEEPEPTPSPGGG
jgi:ribosomal protein S18 acetylase RimI-like enzyme